MCVTWFLSTFVKSNVIPLNRWRLVQRGNIQRLIAWQSLTDEDLGQGIFLRGVRVPSVKYFTVRNLGAKTASLGVPRSPKVVVPKMILHPLAVCRSQTGQSQRPLSFSVFGGRQEVVVSQKHRQRQQERERERGRGLAREEAGRGGRWQKDADEVEESSV